jgi:hypothetical protein
MRQFLIVLSNLTVLIIKARTRIEAIQIANEL